jgi:hypothetical protein
MLGGFQRCGAQDSERIPEDDDVRWIRPVYSYWDIRTFEQSPEVKLAHSVLDRDFQSASFDRDDNLDDSHPDGTCLDLHAERTDARWLLCAEKRSCDCFHETRSKKL